MKIFLTLNLICLFFVDTSAQSISKVEIIDSSLRAIVKDYIDDCHRNNSFYGSKGIISITDVSTEKQRKYSLAVYIDDRYKDDPPTSFGYILHNGTYLVMFYDSKKPVIVENREQYLLQLTSEIGDRVYIRPYVEKRWDVGLYRDTGKVDWGYFNSKIYPGGNYNSVSYTLNPDGTYKKLRGV
jgi:hypothetical protein